MICWRRSAGVGGSVATNRDVGELNDCFDQSGTFQRPLSGLAPKASGLINQTGFGEVTRQKFRLVLSDLRELVFEGFSDASMQSAPRLTQKRTVGRILNKRMFEQIGRVRRNALSEQQTGFDQRSSARFSSCSGLPATAANKRMGELPSDRCTRSVPPPWQDRAGQAAPSMKHVDLQEL